MSKPTECDEAWSRTPRCGDEMSQQCREPTATREARGWRPAPAFASIGDARIFRRLRHRWACEIDVSMTRLHASSYQFPAPYRRAAQLLAVGAAAVLQRVQGVKVPPDSSFSNLRMLLGAWEPGTTELCRALARRGMVVADIGAHTGYFSRLFARCVGREGRVFAFEPHPQNYDLLVRNTATYEMVDAFELAVSNREGVGLLGETPGASGTHFLDTIDPQLPDDDRARGVDRKLRVRTTRLDSFFSARRVHEIGLVKIDVEGSEVAVLEGMAGTIARSPHIAIVVELFPSLWEARGQPNALIDVLRGYDLPIYAIDETSARLRVVSPSVQPQELVAGCGHEHVNLLATRRRVPA